MVKGRRLTDIAGRVIMKVTPPAIILTILFMGAGAVFSAKAVQQSVEFSVDVGSVITLTLPEEPVALAVTPTSEGTFGSSTVNATVNTNSGLGYTLKMNVDQTYLLSDTYNPTTSTFPKIETLDAGSYTESTFTANRWGFKKNSDTTYGPVASENEIKKTTSGTASNEVNTVTLGTKLDLDTSPGSYTTTLNFQLVANTPSPIYMQEVATWGPNLGTGESVKAIDSRDGKKYWVTKLSNGQIWMTQNLDLNIKTSGTNDANGVRTFTSNDTDLNASGSAPYATDYATSGSVIAWTPTVASAATIDATASTTIPGWNDDYYAPYSVDVGNWYQNDTYFASTDCNFMTTSCENWKTTPYAGNGTHGHVGNYYNYAAAIATSAGSSSSLPASGAQAANSICPKGWRLPDNTQGDFAGINTAYNSGSTSSDTGLMASPLWLVRGGYVWQIVGGLYSAGDYGFYWSGTASGSDAYGLGLSDSNVRPANYYSRDGGQSVRCLAR